MSSSPTLESLPFDILFQIAVYLDVRDYIHISHSSRSMFSSMKNTIIARATVKNTMLYSNEGQAAWAGKVGHYQAIQHRFDIHEAVATASPYSVSVLAYATDFLYHQGFLCYRFKNQIRLLNVHDAGQKERVLDLDHVIRRIIGIENILSDVGEQTTLLRFSSGIIPPWPGSTETFASPRTSLLFGSNFCPTYQTVYMVWHFHSRQWPRDCMASMGHGL